MTTSPLIKYLIYQLYSSILFSRKITRKSDIENLHGFRVAIRRSRSLLKLFMPDAYAIAAVLKEIVQKTNELRELDVFLTTVDSQKYPQLTKEIKTFRDNRFETIWSETFKNEIIIALHKLYDELLEMDIDLQKDTLVKTAEEFYAESLRFFHDLPSNESDEKLHDLRIRFKISRYALEFLNESGLYNERNKIKECKRIQNHFGNIQDTVNQLQWLKHFCEQHPSKECSKLTKERRHNLKTLKQYL